MTEEKIRNAATALATLAGKVSAEQWDFIDLVRSELYDAAEQVKMYETCLPIDLGIAKEQEAGVTHG